MSIHLTQEQRDLLQEIVTGLKAFQLEYFEKELRHEKRCHAKDAWRKRARLAKAEKTGQDFHPSDR